MPEPKPIKISYSKGRGLRVTPASARRRVSTNGYAEWSGGKGVKNWRVVFGAYAPVLGSKVASPDHPKLNLVKRRPEDLGHWKYVVVAMTDDNSLVHEDPELIVDS